MPFETLTDEEKRIVFACLCACVKGPFVDHSVRMRSLTSLCVDMKFVHISQDIYLKAIEQWPAPNEKDAEQAVYNSLIIAAHGASPPSGMSEGVWKNRFPRISDADWGAWFSVDRDAVMRLYKKWRGLLEANKTKT